MSIEAREQHNRPRDPRSGEAPDDPTQSRADDPTHGVDPQADRPARPAPTERPGLHGETAHRGAMLQADEGPIRSRTAPAAWLMIAIAVIAILAVILWL